MIPIHNHCHTFITNHLLHTWKNSFPFKFSPLVFEDGIIQNGKNYSSIIVNCKETTYTDIGELQAV